MRRIKTLFLMLLAVLCCSVTWAGENDLLWDYTDAAPSSSPDRGLYFAAKVNDAAGTNLGLKGVKLNSSGWAYFEKAPVAGKLKLTISNRKNTDDFQVNVCHGTLAEGASTPTKGVLIAVSDIANGPTAVSMDLGADVTGVFIDRYSASEGVLCKVEFIETVARAFTDFELNFMNVTEMPAVPAGVISMEGTPRNDDHGLNNFRMVLPVDGPVKFTIGGCQYSGTDCVFKDKAGNQLVSLDVKTPGCYHNGGVATYTYKGGVDTLTIVGAQYMPYIKAEATEVKLATLKFMDQNGVKLAEYELEEGDNVIIPDSLLAKVTVPGGQKFRGWKYSTGKLATTNDKLNGNTTIIASVTNIEQANTGTHYKYNLNNATDYLTDHDLIISEGSGYYHDGTHGWAFGNGDKLKLIVSPKAYVSVGLCTYTTTSDQVIRNAAGDSIACMHVIKDKEEGAIADGTLCSFYYANTSNVQDTLVFNFTVSSYIHFVEVYNVAAPLNKVGHTFDIAAGDAGSFMLACAQLQNGDTIQLHNGIYDLGEAVLTTISASKVVVRGESMDETVVKNAPNAKNEGIATTATILNTGNDNVFENLTLQNALDYYAVSTGRAVCLQDKGTRTACYKVKMLSYQDTYYSNKLGQQCYFEDCEIHGTVDYICGCGSVYFYNCLLYCEKRYKDGGGSDCLTANNSQVASGDKGYVFDRCTIKSECPTVSLGRAWNDQPQVAYLLTTLDMGAGNFSLSGSGIKRWTVAGMNVCAYDFAEYNTMNEAGEVVSPTSNEITFTHTSGNKTIETIIGYEAAEAKSYTHFFTNWNPARNYVAFPEGTALQTVKVVEPRSGKMFTNGQFIIVKDGAQYNAQGIRLNTKH